MTAFGVGRPASCAAAGSAQTAANAAIAALRTSRARMRRICVTLFRLGSTAQVGDRPGHLVRGLNDLGVHLIGALSRNEVGDLGDRVDVGRLDVALLDDPE